MTHRCNSGLAILNSPTYGRDYLRDIGRRGGLVGHGGRPRSLTLTEAISTRPGEGNRKKECAPSTAKDTTGYANMPAKELRAAWLRKVREMEMGR